MGDAEVGEHSEMKGKFLEMEQTVQELGVSNKTILDRLNHLLTSDSDQCPLCGCMCLTDGGSQAVHDLESKLESLERTCTEQESRNNEISKSLRMFQKQMENVIIDLPQKAQKSLDDFYKAVKPFIKQLTETKESITVHIDPRTNDPESVRETRLDNAVSISDGSDSKEFADEDHNTREMKSQSQNNGGRNKFDNDESKITKVAEHSQEIFNNGCIKESAGEDRLTRKAIDAHSKSTTGTQTQDIGLTTMSKSKQMNDTAARLKNVIVAGKIEAGSTKAIEIVTDKVNPGKQILSEAGKCTKPTSLPKAGYIIETESKLRDDALSVDESLVPARSTLLTHNPKTGTHLTEPDLEKMTATVSTNADKDLKASENIIENKASMHTTEKLDQSKNTTEVYTAFKEVEIQPNTQATSDPTHSKDNKSNLRRKLAAMKDTNEGATGGKLPEIIIQTEKKEVTEEDWQNFAAGQLSRASHLGLNDKTGAHTVICVDISASMAEGEAWTQAKQFFNSFIGGLEDIQIEHEGVAEENIAICTFGHNTGVKQTLTQDFCDLRMAFKQLKLGGPSPLYGGLMLSVAALAIPEVKPCMVQDIPIRPRLVLITDGHFTETNVIAGPDKQGDSKQQDEAQSTILILSHKLVPNNIRLTCVPVGDYDKADNFCDFLSVSCAPSRFEQALNQKGENVVLRSKSFPSIVDIGDNTIFDRVISFATLYYPFDVSSRNLTTTFLKLMVTAADGKLVSFTEGRTEAEDTLSKLKECELGLFGGHIELSEKLKELKELQEKFLRDVLVRDKISYHELDDKNLPEIGCRVRRGPDWKWQEQDSHGPGTVIGHELSGIQVWVEWDANGHKNVYRYGRGDYDVLLVDEPRKLPKFETIAVGCIVKKGPGWKSTGDDIGPADRGVVIKKSSDSTVKVRWNKQKKGTYKWDGSRNGEIVVCESSEKAFQGSGQVLGGGPEFEERQRQLNQKTELQKPKQKSARNKNKNVF